VIFCWGGWNPMEGSFSIPTLLHLPPKGQYPEKSFLGSLRQWRSPSSVSDLRLAWRCRPDLSGKLSLLLFSLGLIWSADGSCCLNLCPVRSRLLMGI
jgi:hypothetical protein